MRLPQCEVAHHRRTVTLYHSAPPLSGDKLKHICSLQNRSVVKGRFTPVNGGHPAMNGQRPQEPPPILRHNTDSYNAFSWHTDFSN